MILPRRSFLGCTAAAPAALGLRSLRAQEPASPPRGKVEHCIFVWLGGGAAQIDTWDPKAKGDAQAKQAGSFYDRIPTAIPSLPSIC